MSLQMSLDTLRSESLAVKHLAVQTLAGYQQSYEARDCHVIDNLIAELDTAFADGPKMVQKKGVLGGTKERWVCGSCGEQNALEDLRCSKCARDRQGFLYEEVTPTKATKLLNELREAISAVFQPAS
jgi:hypothetical protein